MDFPTPPPLPIRLATAADLDALLTLRIAMFRELAKVPDDDPLTDFIEATRLYLARALPRGEFLAFVAEAEGRIVATSGLVFFQRAPIRRNLSGREAYILNMYTVPAWRGQGIAQALVEWIVEYVRTETEAKHVFLHAAPSARPVYERAGFTALDDAMGIWLD